MGHYGIRLIEVAYWEIEKAPPKQGFSDSTIRRLLSGCFRAAALAGCRRWSATLHCRARSGRCRAVAREHVEQPAEEQERYDG